MSLKSMGWSVANKKLRENIYFQRFVNHFWPPQLQRIAADLDKLQDLTTLAIPFKADRAQPDMIVLDQLKLQ